jgi:hypothetical protein
MTYDNSITMVSNALHDQQSFVPTTSPKGTTSYCPTAPFGGSSSYAPSSTPAYTPATAGETVAPTSGFAPNNASTTLAPIGAQQFDKALKGDSTSVQYRTPVSYNLVSTSSYGVPNTESYSVPNAGSYGSPSAGSYSVPNAFGSYSLVEPRLTNVSYKPVSADVYANGEFKPFSLAPLQEYSPRFGGMTFAQPVEGSGYPVLGGQSTPTSYVTPSFGTNVPTGHNYPAFASVPGGQAAKTPSQEDLAAYYYNYILPNQAPLYADPTSLANTRLASPAPAVYATEPFTGPPSVASLKGPSKNVAVTKPIQKKKAVCGC